METWLANIATQLLTNQCLLLRISVIFMKFIPYLKTLIFIYQQIFKVHHCQDSRPQLKYLNCWQQRADWFVKVNDFKISHNACENRVEHCPFWLLRCDKATAKNSNIRVCKAKKVWMETRRDATENSWLLRNRLRCDNRADYELTFRVARKYLVAATSHVALEYELILRKLCDATMRKIVSRRASREV